MDIQCTLIGTTPLLTHNPKLADPENKFTQEIKSITDVRGWSDNDELRRKVARLEWFGGLYLDETDPESKALGPVFPTFNAVKSFVEAGRITRDGTDVERALVATSMYVPLVYEGPRDLEKLFALPQHHERRDVGLGSGSSKKRVMRVRPKFFPWVVTVDVVLDQDILSAEQFGEIVRKAGTAIGTCDGRRIGFGRFDGKIT